MTMKKDRPPSSQVPGQQPSTVENLHRWLKTAGEIVTSLVIITTFSSVVIGTIVIRIYLSNFSMPVTPLDTLSAFSLQVFMVFFITLLGSVVALFLVPLTATYFVEPGTRESLPNLFGRRYIPPHTVRPRTAAARRRRPPLLLTRGTFTGFLTEYIMFYFPILALFSLMPIAVYFNVPTQEQTSIFSWAMPLSAVLSGLLLYIFRLKGQPTKIITYYSIAYLNCITIIWLLVFELGMARVWEHNLTQSTTSQKQQLIEAIALSCFGVVCHASMAWHRLSFRVLLLFAALIIYSLHIYPGCAEIGAAALREAQLGGGIPISYTILTSHDTTNETTKGCLVLATSSYVLISQPDNDKCFSLSRFAFTSSHVRARPVRVYSRTEIALGDVPG